MRRMIVSVLVGLMLLPAATAVADPPSQSGVVERSTALVDFIYQGDGVIVLTGPGLEQGCQGEGFTEPANQIVEAPSGVVVETFSYDGEQILVYDDTTADFDGNVFAWIGAACEAVLDGDPVTTGPEPIAQGEGRVSSRVRIDDGVRYAQNWVNGKVVVAATGETVHVDGYVKFVGDGSGSSDLQTLRVNYGG